MLKKIIAVGDCNTLGAGSFENQSYVNRLGQLSGLEVINVGHTMATTREGLFLLRDNMDDADCIIIQFGLVDSYKTVKHSPYVMYYPDNIFRKPLRSLAKKYKKICKKTGITKILGEGNVVALEEYRKNIKSMIEYASPREVILLDTVPNKKKDRNDDIQRYNEMLTSITAEYQNCRKINLYRIFESKLDEFYMDDTHCNGEGYDCIARIIFNEINLSGKSQY